MAAPVANDRKLAAEVRRLTLKELQRILLGNDEAYKKELVLKLASTALPRINEHMGENGGAIKLQQITGMTITPDETTIEDENQTTNSSS